VGVWLPERLPEAPNAVWKKQLSSAALAGVAATRRYVVVADRDATDRRDIFRCFRATDGEPLWQFGYPASGDLDYGNSPRATPLIYRDWVYVLGAFGDLSCVRLDDGEVIWTKNLLSDFSAALSTWGMCASPIIVDDKLIVNPGDREASIVALDPATGNVLWQTPGDRAAYSSFVVGRFGSVRQLVGYDAVSLGGWDIETGRRLWRLVPPVRGDFNVPTPVAVNGRVLVTTEGNGTRIYEFDAEGKICPDPLAKNMDLGPDSSTPVVVGDRVYGCWGELYCLNIRDGLKPVWVAEDPAYENYVSLVAGNDRLLVTSDRGELLLIDISGDSYRLISRLSLVDDDSEVLSHPAFVDHRLYIRDASSIRCIDFGTGA
jgi:outer membrane protein assembly factor BamB